MRIRNCHFISSYRNCFHRICFAMRPNIFLRSNRYYKFSFCCSLHRKFNCTMIMRRIFCKRCYIKTILYITFSFTFYSFVVCGYYEFPNFFLVLFHVCYFHLNNPSYLFFIYCIVSVFSVFIRLRAKRRAYARARPFEYRVTRS